MQSIILGCGDVGRRIARELLAQGHHAASLFAYVNSETSLAAARELGLSAKIIDLDELHCDFEKCDQAEVYYTIAPQKVGVTDQRSKAALAQFDKSHVRPKKIVLISTTGVYGDHDGGWVDETTPPQPKTERGQRRLDSEQQWLIWGRENNVPVVVLRVPGIYAFSRIPRTRLEKRIPVVRASECGFTNRIHADDLAQVCGIAMRSDRAGDIFNVTDGTPGKITEYLMEAAKVLGLPPLPEISMQQAQEELSAGMLSYLGESRRISNEKMLNELDVKLLYPDFRKGLRA